MHILKERTITGEYKYSQARVYLFLSVCFFFVMMSLITLKAFIPSLGVDLELVKSIMEKLTFPMTLFASYAMVAKGIKTFKE